MGSSPLIRLTMEVLPPLGGLPRQGSPNQHRPPVGPEAGEATQGQPTLEVQPQEMYAVVVGAWKAAPSEPPRDAWMTTLAKLFAIIHDTIVIDAELVPPGKKRFPKLRSDEKVVLFQLFEEACVASDASYETWVDYARKAVHSLYNTSWSFKPVLQNMISKVKWAKLPPLNQWAKTSTLASDPGDRADSHHDNRDTNTPLMSNPADYNTKDMQTLRQICLQPAIARRGSRLRDGTHDEWRIIGGFAE
uniref:Uncharacterized protein n=1 Tax=Hyaloperonospora arabidopsidis (strain Emoy2) TaxID=559515 RepID=M4BMK6_HYAAE